MRAELAAERQRREAAEEACAASIAQVCIAAVVHTVPLAHETTAGDASAVAFHMSALVAVTSCKSRPRAYAKISFGHSRFRHMSAHSLLLYIIRHTMRHLGAFVRIDCIHRQSARRCVGGTQTTPQYTEALPQWYIHSLRECCMAATSYEHSGT